MIPVPQYRDGVMTRLPEVLLEKVLRYYSEKKSVFKTAKRFGIGSSTVHRLLKERGVECDGLALYRQRIRKLPDASAIRVEYESGKSMNELAQKYSVAQATVRDALNRAGVVARRRGGQKKVITEADRQQMIDLYREL